MRPTTPMTMAVLVFALILGLEGAAPAQERERMQPGAGEFAPELARCEHLIGAQVRNAEGDVLGTIEDLVFQQPPVCHTAAMEGGTKTEPGAKSGEQMTGEQKTGYGQHESAPAAKESASAQARAQIGYIALRPRGSTDDQKYVAVPWRALRIRSAGLRESPKADVIVNIDKQKFDGAPRFDKNNWPSTADAQWMNQICSYYGAKAPAGHSAGMPSAHPRTGGGKQAAIVHHSRLSYLVGTEIEDRNGQQVAKLDDIIVDTRDGVLAFAVLDCQGRVETAGGSDIVALPWGALNFQMDTDRVMCRLDADRSSLQDVAISENQFHRLRDLAYARDLYQRFDEQPYWETFGYVAEPQHKPAQTGPAENAKEKSERKEREKRDWNYR